MAGAAHAGAAPLATLLPLLYAFCFVALLWQAFRVMGQGFRAVPRPGDNGSASGGFPGASGSSGAVSSSELSTDRTGQVTIHPELLDADGRITREDLLTVRFGGDEDSGPPGSGAGSGPPAGPP
ncbi:MAG: DUF2973 domain-containing protein [Prochlorococcaceae cyanobacterium]